MKRAEKIFMGFVAVGSLALILFWVFYSRNDGEQVLDPALAPGNGGGSKTVMADNGVIEPDGSLPVNEIAQTRESVEPSPEDRAAAKAGATDESGVVTGRVVSEYGDPLPNAEVRLDLDPMSTIYTLLENEAEDRIMLDEISATTGVDGRFRLENVEAGQGMTLKVGHAEHVDRVHPMKAFSGKSMDVGDIALDQGGSVSGIVRDERGAPIADAEVNAFPENKTRKQSGGGTFMLSMAGQDGPRDRSGPDGSYRISGLPEGKADIFANHPDFIGKSEEDILIAKGRDRGSVNLVLPAGLSIEGRVMDGGKKPITGARVSIEQSIHLDLDEFTTRLPFMAAVNSNTKTDEAGYFRLGGLEEGHYVVRVDASGYLMHKQEKVKSGKNDLWIVLEKSAWVAGHIQEAGSGEPVETFEIAVDNQQWNRSKIASWQGAEALEMRPELRMPDGAFVVEGLEPGEFTLNVEAEGFADESMQGLTAVAGKGQVIEIPLWPESSVSGRLLTSDGDPVVGGTVSLGAVQQQQMNSGMGGMLRGMRIERSEGGIMLDDGDEGPVKRATSDADGRFMIRGVAEGEFELKASHTDHTDALPLEVRVDRGVRVENLELRLGRSASISGFVYDMTGAVKPGARVRAKQSGGEDYFGKMASTDAEGAYRFKGLLPGEYQVRLMEDGQGGPMGGIMSITLGGDEELPPGTVVVTVKEGEVHNLDLYESARGSLSGRVTEAGQAVADCGVKLFKAGPFLFMPMKTAKTDKQGDYLIEDIPAGSYVVRVDMPGVLENEERDVTLAEGDLAQEDFDLPTGQVTGIIVDQATGDPLAGARVHLEAVTEVGEEGEEDEEARPVVMMQFASVSTTESSDGDSSVQTITMDGGGTPTVKTDKDGRYTIRFVRDGKFQVVSENDGYARAQSSPVEVKEGRKADAGELPMRNGFTLAGMLLNNASGAPIPFCPIQLSPLDDAGELLDDVEVNMAQSDGSFTFKDLSPGGYRVSVDTDQFSGEKDVKIGLEDIGAFELHVTQK